MADSNIEITVKDNTKEIETAFTRQVLKALKAIGMAAEGHAKDGTPVDTGRLRNSITYATEEYSGTSSYSNKKGEIYNDGGAKAVPEEGSVYIGTNVEYAVYIEEGSTTHKASHMLRHAVADNGAEYKQLMLDALRDG